MTSSESPSKNPHAFCKRMHLNWIGMNCYRLMIVSAYLETHLFQERNNKLIISVHKFVVLQKWGGGTLDYVAAWFIRAGEYISKEGKIGFVATNSITQGEQVAQLWPILFQRHKLDIQFAHSTYLWESDAKGKAHVFVVIIGLVKQINMLTNRKLFSYIDFGGEPDESLCTAISPYLFNADNLDNPKIHVELANRQINGYPQMIIGSQPIDDGQYILNSKHEVQELLKECPAAEALIRPFVGTDEFLKNKERYILWMGKTEPRLLRCQALQKRIVAVRKFRETRKRKSTQKIALTPTLYSVNVIPESSFLVIPGVSTSRREYIPIGWLEPPVVPSNLVHVIEEARKSVFTLLTSSMHMAWLRYIGGRLGNGYRYSIGVVYNTYPFPPINKKQEIELERHANEILGARAEFPDSTLFDLYEPNLMPSNLRKAHTALDRAVDRIYRPRKAFNNEHERIKHLLMLYEKSINQPNLY